MAGTNANNKGGGDLLSQINMLFGQQNQPRPVQPKVNTQVMPNNGGISANPVAPRIIPGVPNPNATPSGAKPTSDVWGSWGAANNSPTVTPMNRGQGFGENPMISLLRLFGKR